MRNAIINLNLDVSLIIPIIEEAIEQERIKLEVNEILHNEADYHRTVQGIAQTKILLSLLRRCEPCS